MSTLLTKMKIAVDNANEICSTHDFSKDECVTAWAELDNLVERYTILSKNIQQNKKNVVDTPDWDVIH